MKLIKDREFLRSIANQINLFNTIGGGISETYVDIKKYKKGAVIQVWAAGVNPEAFKVVLQNNQLTIFSLLQNQNSADLTVPMFTQVFLLPPQVDISRIEAVYEEGQLHVKLPYHDAAIRPKEIEIKQL
ncbi:Hsp20/alpha crystallin family protein [Pontibacter vulgaris]|uniref:Hsp20/alpha crystallin family protein n=1 Tax=Pontibacter vulgaris TaxID=2905679 RepID=UPI001FA6D47C|nr:Hsp20/alpha crystallin family protein [Pontibacter vulgaris]